MSLKLVARPPAQGDTNSIACCSIYFITSYLNFYPAPPCLVPLSLSLSLSASVSSIVELLLLMACRQFSGGVSAQSTISLSLFLCMAIVVGSLGSSINLVIVWLGGMSCHHAIISFYSTINRGAQYNHHHISAALAPSKLFGSQLSVSNDA